MCWSAIFLISLITGCAIGNVKGTTSSAIPKLLLDCYSRNFTAISKPPFTIKLFIELIRKIELNKENAFNMRILATSLLHGVVLDGVRKSQYVGDDTTIPYRAIGEEFYKYKLIVDLLTSGERSLLPSESLTTPELCFLHKMVSRTVAPWRRGDESRTCVHQSSMPFELGFSDSTEGDVSTCPIRMGNVYTKWGTVSAGEVIAAVASALQQTEATFQRIEDAINKATNKNVTAVPPTIMTDANNVNNVWVSTIAGDLAAVILNQATSTPELGTEGFWNDTLLPRRYYLKSPKWDMTETDILAGIDALAIASAAKSLHTDTGIRLSQLIDMYYSERGIVADKASYIVTNRTATLNNLLTEINLEQQVIGTAKLLKKVGTYDVSLSDADINKLASIVTDKFRVVAGNIIRAYDVVEGIHGKQMKSPVEIIVILDGSYDAYTAQQMIHALAEAAQVSHYGSKLGVINGQSGNWMANVTGELFQLFTDLQKAENEWPATLSLSRSLETAIYYYQNKTTTDCTLDHISPIGRSILIITPDGRLTDNDFVSSVRAFNSIKNSNPEIHFILVTTPRGNSTVAKFTRNFRDNDYILTPPENMNSLVEFVADTLSTVSGNIINFYCSQSQVHLQDYITPDVETSYHIRREYIKEAQITTKFAVSDQGQLTVCVLKDSGQDRVCKDVTVNGEISFDSEELCAPESACNLEFRVSLNESKIQCTENDCRYPDQVRLDITWQRSSGLVPLVMYQCLIMSVLILIL